jgi:hypothetical protein
VEWQPVGGAHLHSSLGGREGGLQGFGGERVPGQRSLVSIRRPHSTPKTLLEGGVPRLLAPEEGRTGLGPWPETEAGQLVSCNVCRHRAWSGQDSDRTWDGDPPLGGIRSLTVGNALPRRCMAVWCMAWCMAVRCMAVWCMSWCMAVLCMTVRCMAVRCMAVQPNGLPRVWDRAGTHGGQAGSPGAAMCRTKRHCTVPVRCCTAMHIIIRAVDESRQAGRARHWRRLDRPEAPGAQGWSALPRVFRCCPPVHLPKCRPARCRPAGTNCQVSTPASHL